MVNEKIVTVPNLLTSLRIFLVPFFIGAMKSTDYSMALKIVIIAGLTDFLDGVIARKFHQESKIGTFLDPFADKILLLSIMITFYINELAPRWFLTIVFCRDLLVASGWIESYLRRKRMMKPTILGKVSNASQVIIFGYILLSINFSMPKLSKIFYLFASSISLASLIQYIYIRFKDAKNRS